MGYNIIVCPLWYISINAIYQIIYGRSFRAVQATKINEPLIRINLPRNYYMQTPSKISDAQLLVKIIFCLE